MKKLAIIILLIVSGFSLQARNLWAFLTYATFNSPEGPYVETYLSVAGNSVKWIRKENGKFQATVNVMMTFKQDNVIKAFNKYDLFSPEIGDTVNIDFHFLDEQRFPLVNGNYDFEIQLSDKNKDVKPVPYVQQIVIDFPADKPSISGIELLKSYTKAESQTKLTKSGYDLVPNVFTYYPETDFKMSFYCELYNMDKSIGKDQKFLLSYYIETMETNLRLNDYSRVKKETAKDINVLLAEFNIDNLATGNYNMVVEARNQQNELIGQKKLFFQRKNPNARISMAEITQVDIQNTFAEKYTNPDTLREYISSTFPISSGIERAFIKGMVKTADLKTLQQYFYTFWEKRDMSNPQAAWLKYQAEVNKVNYNFGTPVKKGYQTDRGRVYLEYGPPNIRSQQYNEPSNYPYEIWQYYTLNNNQRNKRFVFYSPDMVTSDFFLLHSDAQGEVYNSRWQIDLRNRIYQTKDLQDTQVINSWGDMQQFYWDTPN